MSKLTRVLLNVFGLTGDSSYFGKFGSRAAGSPVNTKDIATIQALSAYNTGLQDALNAGNKAPFLEDFNSLMYLKSYQLAYILQEGIPEWETGTTYYIGSIVKQTGTSNLYISLIDSNIGNALPNRLGNSNWRYLDPSGVPIGSVNAFAGATAPTGYLLCQGQNVSRATYAELFTLIGINYGIGDGLTTFTLPDLRNRSPIGVSGTKALALIGGAETVTLNANNLPEHPHTFSGYALAPHDHTIYAPGGAGSNISAPKFDTGVTPTPMSQKTEAVSAGIPSGTVNNNITANNPVSIMQPYVAMNYIIKY